MVLNLREKNIERLQRQQKELIQPARINKIEEDVRKVNRGVAEAVLSSGKPPIESQRSRRTKSLKEQQKKLIKKNGLNFNMFT